MPEVALEGGVIMSVMGRPKIPIDWEEFDKLCSLQCTLNEIAGWFKCSPDTIERRVQEEYDRTFADYHNEKRQLGIISLRRRQYQIAMEGNVTMLIFLGKNLLNQSDKTMHLMAEVPQFKLAYNIESEVEDDRTQTG